MGLEFVERFFKLTLDNVYRFVCSLLFAVTAVAYSQQRSPIEQLANLLNWLAIPSGWLIPIAEWVNDRQIAVGGMAVLALAIAIGFATTTDWRSRSGSTVLLSIVTLVEVGQGPKILPVAVVVFAGIALLTGTTAVIARRLRRDTPEWVGTTWKKVANTLTTLVLAALYLFSPFGWLTSQEPYDARGTIWNPLYFEQVERRQPQGSASVR